MALLFVALGLVSPLRAAGLLDHWQVRHPHPVGVALVDVQYTRGAFFAVGGGGTILRSESGTNWNSLDTPSDAYLWSLCEGPGALFAVGDTPDTLFRSDRPTILRSTNGLSWSSVEAPKGSWGYRKLIYAKGMLMAAGLSGQISTSTDGLTWRNQQSFTFANILGLAFGNGVFVAGTSAGEMITSTNGTNWSVQDLLGVRRIESLIFANNAFLAVATDGGTAKLMASDDGLRWTERAAPLPRGSGYRLAFENGGYFTMGYLSDENQGILNISTNGTDWTSVTLESSAGYNAIAFGAGNYVLAGSPGNLLVSSNAAAASAWQSVVTRTFQDSFTGVAHGAGTFVAVGASGTIARSTSGSDWSRKSPPRTSNFAGVAYGNGRFVTVGNSPGLIAHSPDGSTWAEASFTPTTNIATIFFGNNLFLAGGEGGTILRSNDGASWQSTSVVEGEIITGFACGNGIFLCTSSGGVTRISTDGITWRKTAESLGNNCAFGAGFFIVAGNHSAYYTSLDGITWQGHSRGDYYWPARVAYLRDTFLLYGTSGSGLYSSADAKTWTRRFPRTGSVPNAIAWAPDTFVMVAGAGILQSGRSFSLGAAKVSGSDFTLELSAPDIAAVVIESSEDLQTWAPATNSVEAGASRTFPREKRKFYRAGATNKP